MKRLLIYTLLIVLVGCNSEKEQIIGKEWKGPKIDVLFSEDGTFYYRESILTEWKEGEYKIKNDYIYIYTLELKDTAKYEIIGENVIKIGSYIYTTN